MSRDGVQENEMERAKDPESRKKKSQRKGAREREQERGSEHEGALVLYNISGIRGKQQSVKQ